MPEILRCPACGGADTSVVSTDGVHTCVFCGVRYRVAYGVPTAAQAARRPTAALAAGLALLLCAVGGAFVFTLIEGRSSALVAVAPADPPDADTLVEAGAAAPPVASTSTPPPAEPEPSASFAEHRTRKASGEAFWILGVVTNTSPYTIDAPRFDIVFLDASGAEVGVNQSYASGDAMRPGETRPVALLAATPPAHASFRVEPRPKKATWEPERADGLVLTEFPVTEGSFGGWQLSGKVRNDGAAPARFVRVTSAAWDDAGTLVGVDHTYAAGEERLPVGAEARYTLRLSTTDPRPTRFTTVVEGRR